jgi:RimJ/RimL family protein N-acetyltransferase
VPVLFTRAGAAVVVREIRPDDGPALRWGFDHLSAQSRHQRFLVPKPRLSSGEVRYLTQIDGTDHFALVAMLADDPEQLVAVARFVRLPGDPTTAEAAIVVADELQGQGLGKRLGLLLADAARERGVGRFVATMLSDNLAAHRIFLAISTQLESGHAGGVRELVAELAA